jgi:hypothetical protein
MIHVAPLLRSQTGGSRTETPAWTSPMMRLLLVELDRRNSYPAQPVGHGKS